MEMTTERREWKEKAYADPTQWDKGTMMMLTYISSSYQSMKQSCFKLSVPMYA
jgi:hypothetical protein